MKHVARFCVAVLIFGSVAVSQDHPSTPDRAPLLLVQQIPLPNVGGRIDHFTFDAKRKRVIGAALGNNTVEVVDTFAGRDIHSVSGAANPQGVVYVGEFDKLLSRMAQMENSESTTEIRSSCSIRLTSERTPTTFDTIQPKRKSM